MSMKKLFNRMPAACLAVAAVLLLVAPGAQAMKMKSQNLTQMISASENIIHGQVVSVTDGFDDKGVPYTEVTIDVASVAKGNAEEGGKYTFRQFGLLKPRKMPNGLMYVGVSPEGFPRWFEGETVVVFMNKPARITGLQSTAGMDQGKLRLVNGSLVNAFDNAGMWEGVEIDSGSLSNEERNMMTQPGAVDAAAFMGLVGRAVEESWIEKGVMK